MKRLVLTLCALAALASSAAALDTPAPTARTWPAVLSKPYAVTLGDMIAFCITQSMPVLKGPADYDAGVIASYDHAGGKILVTIFGGRTSVDEAKVSMETFRTKVVPLLSAEVSKSYHVALDESALTIIYVTGPTMHEVIRREGTKYLVSSE